MRFFFYGTLLDPDICAVVLGRPVAAEFYTPGLLNGYRRVTTQGELFPLLLPAATAHVKGAVTPDLDREALQRIAFFEADEFDAAPHRVRLLDGGALEAVVFVKRKKLSPRWLSWDLARWQRRHKPAFLRETKEWMRRYHGTASHELNRLYRAGLRGGGRRRIG